MMHGKEVKGLPCCTFCTSTVKNLLTKSRDQSSGREDAPEKEMATHSRILAWRTPWTEEPAELQSMGSQSWT